MKYLFCHQYDFIHLITSCVLAKVVIYIASISFPKLLVDSLANYVQLLNKVEINTERGKVTHILLANLASSNFFFDSTLYLQTKCPYCYYMYSILRKYNSSLCSFRISNCDAIIILRYVRMKQKSFKGDTCTYHLPRVLFSFFCRTGLHKPQLNFKSQLNLKCKLISCTVEVYLSVNY